jgi:hypothetical protein
MCFREGACTILHEGRLFPRLREVRSHAESFAAREFSHFLKKFPRNRIWGMGRYADTLRGGLLASITSHLLREPRHRLDCRPLSGTKHFLVSNTLQTELQHRVPTGSDIHHLAYSRHPGAQHLSGAQLS